MISYDNNLTYPEDMDIFVDKFAQDARNINLVWIHYGFMIDRMIDSCVQYYIPRHFVKIAKIRSVICSKWSRARLPQSRMEDRPYITFRQITSCGSCSFDINIDCIVVNQLYHMRFPSVTNVEGFWCNGIFTLFNFQAKRNYIQLDLIPAIRDKLYEEIPNLRDVADIGPSYFEYTFVPSHDIYYDQIYYKYLTWPRILELIRSNSSFRFEDETPEHQALGE